MFIVCFFYLSKFKLYYFVFVFCTYYSDAINIFFSNIGSTLSEAIKLDDSTLALTDYLNNPTEHRFNFSKISENKTLTIINNLKSTNSSGKDEISNKLLKSIICEISKPLTIIINQSLETGILIFS